MAREDPLEGRLRETLHGPGLLRPAVPAGASRGPKLPSPGSHGEMVPRKQVPLPEEQAGRPRSVAGNRDKPDLVVQCHGLCSGETALDKTGAGIILVQDPLAPEVSMKLVVVGHVVPVGQEKKGDPAQLFQALDEGPRVPGESTGMFPPGRTIR